MKPKPSKGQLILIIVRTLVLIASVVVIILENKAGTRKYSFILLGIAFILYGVDYFINYKNSKATRYLVLAIIFAVLGLLIGGFSIV